MATQFVFPCEITEAARPVIDAEALPRYRAALQKFAGKRAELVLRKPKSKRSLVQNAWHWAIAVPMIAEALGYDRHEYEMVHYALVSKCFGVRQDPKLGEVPNVRSSKLTVQQFAELMEWEVRFAAEFCGVALPLPREAEPEVS
jgi:hypothetical protein